MVDTIEVEGTHALERGRRHPENGEGAQRGARLRLDALPREDRLGYDAREDRDENGDVGGGEPHGDDLSASDWRR